MKIANDEWKHLLHLPTRRVNYRLVAIGTTRIAFVGGVKNGTLTADVDVYNIRTKQWSQYVMKEKRHGHAAVAIGEIIYIFGGNSCETIDLSNGNPKSKYVPKMHLIRYDFPAVVYNQNKIVLVGGCWEVTFISNVAMFDTIDNTWTTLTSLPRPQRGSAAGIAGDKLIVVGGFGYNHILSADIFDFQKRQWNRVANMGEPRALCGGAVIGPFEESFHMVVCGGNEKQSAEIYNFQKNEWSTLPKHKSDVENCQVVVIDGKLVAAGKDFLEYLDLLPEYFDRLSKLDDSPYLIAKLKDLIASIELTRYTYPQECEKLMTAFRKGMMEALNPTQNDFKHAESEGNVMELLGALCALISKVLPPMKSDVIATLERGIIGINKQSVEATDAFFRENARGNLRFANMASHIQDHCLTAAEADNMTGGGTMQAKEEYCTESPSGWATVTVKGCAGPKFCAELYNDDHDIDIFVAIYSGYMDFLSDLFADDSNVDVNQEDSMGRSPTDFAAIMGEPEMMDLLMQKGGKCRMKNTVCMRLLARKRREAKNRTKHNADKGGESV